MLFRALLTKYQAFYNIKYLLLKHILIFYTINFPLNHFGELKMSKFNYKKIQISLFPILLFSFIACSSNNELKLCQSQYDSNNYSQAITTCEGISAKDSTGIANYILFSIYNEQNNGDKALEYLNKSANQNNPKAQSRLAYYFLWEEKDMQKAQELYKTAALQGYPEAERNYGILLELNEQHNKEGRQWLEKAATHNDETANYLLGAYYYVGNDLYTQDFKKAHEYLLKAADLGYTDAYIVLGFMYLVGNGVEINPQLAYEYWQKAYKQDHPVAKMLLTYDDLEEYFLRFTSLKVMFIDTNDKNDDNHLPENIKWLKNDGKKFLIHKELTEEELAEGVLWLKDRAYENFDFAVVMLSFINRSFGYKDKADQLLSENFENIRNHIGKKWDD